MANKEKANKEKGRVNSFNKIQTQEYPQDYYTGEYDQADGQAEFLNAIKDLDQTELGKLNKKLKKELEKGNKPTFKLKK